MEEIIRILQIKIKFAKLVFAIFSQFGMAAKTAIMHHKKPL
jgi:hypothetical protein